MLFLAEGHQAKRHKKQRAQRNHRQHFGTDEQQHNDQDGQRHAGQEDDVQDTPPLLSVLLARPRLRRWNW